MVQLQLATASSATLSRKLLETIRSYGLFYLIVDWLDNEHQIYFSIRILVLHHSYAKQPQLQRLNFHDVSFENL